MSCDIKLTAEDARMTTFPLSRPKTFDWYMDAQRCYWVPSEINPTTDAAHYLTMTPDEQHFIKHVLAFFAASDGIVNVNIVERFRKDIPILEVAYFYDFQIMMENTHAHTYSMLLDAIIPTASERNHLLRAIETMPIIGQMTDFMKRCIASDASLAERLLRMACVEGIFFTGCFCVIHWFQNRGLMPALGHSNELIARDEMLHTYFAMHLYDLIEPERQLTHEHVHAIVDEAMVITRAFIREALPNGMFGMNADLMIKYNESQADELLSLISVAPLYKATHSFTFMTQQALANRTAFFERRGADYAKPIVSQEVVSTFGEVDVEW